MVPRDDAARTKPGKSGSIHSRATTRKTPMTSLTRASLKNRLLVGLITAAIAVFGNPSARIGQPLPELVADVEQTIGVAVEAQVRARRMRGPFGFAGSIASTTSSRRRLR